ncbi:MAG: hypothetical protein AVO35_08400 [Candidatus Aegiribacteria sp. MLS_C]|nr:MAG: hypothetical protein AVO35_08400 [Candidatus Aegiribacteria sp. MLS_C]
MSYAFILALIMVPIAAAEYDGQPIPFDDYLYPGEEVVLLAVQLGDTALEEALAAALEELEEAGGEDILFCSIMRIEAPLAGYLLDGLWRADIQGREYGTFRVGVEDGGTPFVLIARGVGSGGEVHWYPPPGPDWRPGGNCETPESFLDYEFLIGREAFEDIEEVYPRPHDGGSD